VKALSIRQPWAWLIVSGYKDIENRTWETLYRGRVMVHAGKSMTRAEYDDCDNFVAQYAIDLPPFKKLVRGGIVGSVEIVACTRASDSRWFVGPFGFVLRQPRLEKFREVRGRLGLFEVPA
jgi:ASCH domain